VLPREDKWNLKELVKKLDVNNHEGWTDTKKDALIEELSRLEKVQCTECEGFGHGQSECGTYARIQKLTKGVK
jgi:hypothetical protein